MGYIIISALDMVGVAAVVPLIGMFTGADYSAGAVGIVWRMFGSPDRDTFVLLLAAGVVGAFIVKAIVSLIFRWWSLGFLARQQVETSADVMRRLLLAPYSLHRQRSLSEFAVMIGPVVGQAYTVVNSLLAVVAETAAILAVMITLAIINPLVAISTVVLFGLLGWTFQWIVRRRVKQLGTRVLEGSDSAYKAVVHAFGGVKDVKLRNNPDPFVQEFDRSEWKKADAARQAAFFSEMPKYMFEVLFVIGIAALAFLITSQGSPEEAVATLAVFATAGFRLLPSATRLVASANIIRSNASGVERLVDELAMLRDLGAEPARRLGIDYRGDLEIKHVSFAYPGGGGALDDITLSIPQGSSVALVGASGAGKSTLVDLVLGFQSPSSGTISCGGRDISTSLPDWQDTIGLVPQEVFLLDASLRENIAFDVERELIDEERLRDAVRRAQLDDIIAEHPDGLDLRVGDRGARLSGGQRQRVGIARALYRNPDVLILDEATSALDNETERRITQTIEALHGDVTVIVVAHRLSTVRNSDQFVMLNEGRVESAGSFIHVRATSPDFEHMVQLAVLGVDEPEHLDDTRRER